jgi:hypothetical protein
VKSYETTPLQIASLISKSLAGDIVIAKVDGELWDLDRPLEKSCHLQFLKFDDAEGRAVYWHSSAHVLGEAAERHYGCLLSHGPPTSDGFFYDMAMDDRYIVSRLMLMEVLFQWKIILLWRRLHSLLFRRNNRFNDWIWTKIRYWRCSSIASIRSILSRIRFPMEEVRRFIVVVHSSTCVRVHISPIRDESKHSQS